MKKVLFVATVVRLHINMFHKPFIKWFHDQGWQVDVAANNDYPNPEDCRIPFCDHFHCIPYARSPLKKDNLQAYKQLKALLEREHYDIIHCHTPMGGVIARLAASASRKHGTKVIYTAHGFHFFKGAPLLNWLAYYPVERLLARKTDLLITMNQEDYTAAKKLGAGRVEFVNGVGMDLDKFTAEAYEDRDAVRRELGLKEGQTFAISVAQLIKRKNHSVLLQAVKKLNDPDFRLFICGDGVLEPQLKAEADALGIGEQVRFLGFRRDVYRLCRAADLFLFGSYQEGLPVAVMEAMACGLPIVASDIRGNRDLIGDGEGGLLVSPRDPEGFARAIREITGDGEKLERMRLRNSAEVRKYGIEAVTEQMARLYESMM